MFTGIIEATAETIQVKDDGLVIARPKIFDDLRIGCSIAVSGACLTVTHFDEKSMHFDVVPTTFGKTKLGDLKAGDFVNLERAMPAQGRFEGHIVLGHIEGTGTVTRHTDGLLTISAPDHLMQYVVLHGCIMIDGIALTVAELEGSEVTIAIIPHTHNLTTIEHLKEKDRVNLETDVLAKYLLGKR